MDSDPKEDQMGLEIAPLSTRSPPTPPYTDTVTPGYVMALDSE